MGRQPNWGRDALKSAMSIVAQLGVPSCFSAQLTAISFWLVVLLQFFVFPTFHLLHD
jgi:hypothetical protein